MSLIHPAFDLFVRDFSPGFQETPDSDALPLGATPEARNAMFTHVDVQADGGRRATFRRRTGARLINPTAMSAAKAVETLIEFQRDNAVAQVLAVCDTNLYQWDGSTTFTLLSAAAFTAGRSVQACQHKNLAFLMDGAATKLWDGTTLGDPGLTTPAAPTLATAAGPGVTGDYDGYVTWVNDSRVIESSPSDPSAVVTFANQQRQWSRPASPPSGATHWRVYCRKSNEREYYQTGTDQTVATATYTESIADSARTQPGPTVSSNDPPPAFEGMVVWNGHGIAWARNASEVWVSKQNYLESWHPSHRIALKRNQKVRSVALVGDTCLLETDTQTFQLEGDKFPFRLKNVHTQWGNVSAQGAQEVDGRLYAFDQERGPYVTDGVNFAPLGDATIRATLNTLNVSESGNIRCAHYRPGNLVLWAFATGTQTRRRTILAYHTRLRSWLPPITGLEFGSLCTVTLSDNTIGLFLGDYWGRVFQFFSGDVDGVPSGTDHTKPITAATSSTVTCGAATFATSGNGLAGLPVGILSPSGAWQIRRIQSNTATVLTLDTTNDPVLPTVPASDGTWTAVVGLIEFYWWTPWVTCDAPHVQKRGGFLLVQAGASNVTNGLDVQVRVNGSAAIEESFSLTFPTTGGLWGVSTWGIDQWGGGAVKNVRRRRLARAFRAIQFRFSNYYPDQPFEVTGYGVGADPLPRRRGI